ncbi:hypothetical protein Rsub_08925 [Raphidocelis subcapitata]|uniref:Uncharacterized protein n=1 Tax=Raphidocelis subcapitata TaxID=307507 RepID=A0A2V0PG48_9CHLO|nr:hypothetical protein Rsub_08925 [Raphidocelis subcapitata]|eukprot:GBF96177.1 hypothetical protein Rsub_08925 [Raphidocelis subcapitata]
MQAHRAVGSAQGGVAQRRGVTARPVAAAARPRAPARRARAVAQAGKDDRTTGNSALDTALTVGRGFVDSASALVPESVPRPLAKGGVAALGVLLAFWLLQKVLSTLLTVALLGGAAFLYFRSTSSGGGGDDNGGGGGGGGRGAKDDPTDPLADAKRIMQKWR